MNLSVIIPTHNRGALLERTLRSISTQIYPKDSFEVIIVDDRSTDNTRDVVTAASGVLRQVRFVSSERPGLHEGRNLGLRLANSDILVYADDDIDAFPGWLEGIAMSFTDDQVGLVGGKNLPNYESPPPAWLEKFWVTVQEGKYITYFSLLDFGDEIRVVNPQYVFGCNFSVRKSIVQDAKGFHPDALPSSMIRYRGDGETHVARHAQRMGYKAIYNPNASVMHWVPTSRMNFEYLLKRSFAEGITQSYTHTRNKYLQPNASADKNVPWSTLKDRVRNLLTRGRPKQIQRSFQAGYAYHQEELLKDKELLAWVLKESYIDNELPG